MYVYDWEAKGLRIGAQVVFFILFHTPISHKTTNGNTHTFNHSLVTCRWLGAERVEEYGLESSSIYFLKLHTDIPTNPTKALLNVRGLRVERLKNMGLIRLLI